MRLEMLVSAMNESADELIKKMGIESDAIIINQTDHVDYRRISRNGHNIDFYSFNERGVGLSRNNALLRATADIVLFADEDIVYDKGYEKKVTDEFEKHPEADFLLFNMRVNEGRATYYNKSCHRVHIWNAGRYPTYAFAARRDKLHAANITFSLLFGGGAPYSNGEDSLFLKDCLKYGLRVYASNVELGEETVRESTWFKGYTEKFFKDRGVLYHFLYGRLAGLMSFRFILAHKDKMCEDIPPKNALRLMREGYKSVKGY